MNWIESSLVQQFVNGQLRHILTGVGGSLITLGAFDKTDLPAFVTISTGIISVFGGMAWSAASKFYMSKFMKKVPVMEPKNPLEHYEGGPHR